MCGRIDDAVRDAERRSWKYVECSRTWAASFVAAGRKGAREEWSGGKPDSGRAGGRKYLFGCAIFEEIERARCGDYSGVAERCCVDQGTRVVEQVIPDQGIRQYHG